MNYEAGKETKPFEIQVDKYRPYYYAGASGDFNPIHLDDNFAKQVGLGGSILHGLCTMAFIYRSVMENNDPAKIKKLKVRFRQMVRPLDKLIVKGRVNSIENNLTSVELMAENQKGERVITSGLAIVDM